MSGDQPHPPVATSTASTLTRGYPSSPPPYVRRVWRWLPQRSYQTNAVVGGQRSLRPDSRALCRLLDTYLGATASILNLEKRQTRAAPVRPASCLCCWHQPLPDWNQTPFPCPPGHFCRWTTCCGSAHGDGCAPSDSTGFEIYLCSIPEKSFSDCSLYFLLSLQNRTHVVTPDTPPPLSTSRQYPFFTPAACLVRGQSPAFFRVSLLGYRSVLQRPTPRLRRSTSLPIPSSGTSIEYARSLGHAATHPPSADHHTPMCFSKRPAPALPIAACAVALASFVFGIFPPKAEMQ